MQEPRDLGESILRLRRVFLAHVIDDLHHLRRQHVECLRRNCGTFRHHVLEVQQQAAHMVGHLLRREWLAHQRRITDHRLNTGLRHEAVHQTVHRVFILRVIHQHKGVRRREDLLYLRFRLGGEENRRAAGKEPTDEEQQYRSYRHRQFMPRDEHRHTVRRRDVGFLGRRIDDTTEEQHQRRHCREGTYERTDHTLGQHDTHVGTDFQTHEAEHQQSYDGCESRREDRRRRFTDSPVGCDDSRAAVGVLILLLTVAVQQHDTVIEREHRLQDRTDEVRRDRYGRQQRVRTHIQHDSQTGSDQDHHGFKPRLGHHEKDQHDHHRRDNHHRHRRRRSVLTGLYHAVSTETGADLLA